MLSNDQLEQLREDGYLLVKGVLDPERLLAPFERAYRDNLHALLSIICAERNLPEPRNDLELPEIVKQLLLVDMPLAISYLHTSNISYEKEVPRPHPHLYPLPRLAEDFALITSQPILDIAESLVGPELVCTGMHHVNMKLPRRHLEEVQAFINAEKNEVRRANWNHTVSFICGKTFWHHDNHSCNPDTRDAGVYDFWIPFHESSDAAGTGPIVVAPGSHKLKYVYGQHMSDKYGGTHRGKEIPPEIMANETVVEAKPGDILILDNWIFHAAKALTGDRHRLAVNVRFVKRGSPVGRPHAPSFVARSRSNPELELRNAQLWQLMWARTLDYLWRCEAPMTWGWDLTLEESQALTERWNKLCPTPAGWVRLSKAEQKLPTPGE